MKKLICIILIVLFILSLAACGKTPVEENAATDSPADVVTTAAEPTEEVKQSSDGIDIDLTAMSSTMVYSEVLNMQQDPESYLGKVVKMKGPFNVTEIDDKRYFACIIADATACCSTGIEFVRKGDYNYPEDYPEPKQEITVVGTFNTYMEGKSKYLQLKDAEVQF